MCHPTTIAATATVVSGAYSAIQQVQQGQYQEGVSDYNAVVAENEAQRVQNKSVEEENDLRQQTAELVSSQRSALGASGIAVDSGSALQLQEDAIIQGEADAMRIRDSYDDQVQSLEDQAEFQRNYGDAMARAGYTSAFGTLLSSGAKAFATPGLSDKWDKWF